MKIYHIVLPEVWAARSPDEGYEAESLRSEGFIHCSYFEQLDAVLGRYYGGAGRVFILEIETDKLSSKMVAECSTSNEVYPHIYGSINPDAIVGIVERLVD